MNENVVVSNLLAFALEPQFSKAFCNYCFKSLDDLKPIRCENCYFTTYCTENCRRCDLSAGHQLECDHMIGKWKHWSSTGEAWTKSSDYIGGIECALLMYRLLLKSAAGELINAKARTGPKTWSNLMTHSAEVKAEKRFGEFFNHCMNYIRRNFLPGTSLGLKDEKSMEVEEELWEIFCKILINAHCILVWNSKGKNVVIGLALGLELAAYDHSCSPNAQVHWFERRAYIVSLIPGLDAHNVSKTFISYKWLMESKKARSALLARDYFFTCTCNRCKLSADNLLTSMRCRSCRIAIPLSEDEFESKLDYRKNISCSACKQCQDPEEVENVFNLFADLRISIDRNVLPTNPLIERALNELPYENLYRAKVLQRLLEEATLTPKERMKHSLEFLEVAKRSMPAGYQQLIPYTLYACQACILCAELEKASGLLHEVEHMLELAFIDGPCPFEKLLDGLYQQLAKATQERIKTKVII